MQGGGKSLSSMRILIYLLFVAFLSSSKTFNTEQLLYEKLYDSKSNNKCNTQNGYPSSFPVKYTSNSDNAPDPVLLLFEMKQMLNQELENRLKRNNMPSLSISNPIEVLRNRLEVEINRRRKLESVKQIERNRQFMNKIGKRIIHSADDSIPC